MISILSRIVICYNCNEIEEKIARSAEINKEENVMKKVSALILCIALLSIALVIPALAARPPAPQTFDMPKAVKAPTFDGKIDADEWKGALVRDLTDKSTVYDPIGYGLDDYKGTKWYFMWDEKGLYLAADVKFDNSLINERPRDELYNVSGTLQVLMYRDSTTPAAGGEMQCFDLHPKLADGKPGMEEVFTIADKITDRCKIAVTFNNDGYVMEAFFPAEVVADSTASPISFESGKSFRMCLITITDAFVGDECYADCEWFNAAESNTYNFTDARAGGESASGTSTGSAKTGDSSFLIPAASLLLIAAFGFVIIPKKVKA